MGDSSPGNGSNDKSGLSGYGSIASIAGCIFGAAYPVASFYFELGRITEALFYAAILLCLTISVMIWCQVWTLNVYKTMKALTVELGEVKEKHRAEVALATEKYRAEVSRLKKDIESYEKKSNASKKIMMLLGETAHDINDTLRDLDEECINFGNAPGEHEKPYLKEFLNAVLGIVARYFEDKTDFPCSAALKMAYPVTLKDGSETIGVTAFLRDFKSGRLSNYRITDGRFPKDADNEAVIVDQCYEYAMILTEKNGKNFCVIPDVNEMKDKDGNKAYYHAFELEVAISFVSKLVVPICYRGNNNGEAASGLERLIGFIEVECQGTGLTNEDFPFLATVADRFYTTFRNQETQGLTI